MRPSSLENIQLDQSLSKALKQNQLKIPHHFFTRSKMRSDENVVLSPSWFQFRKWWTASRRSRQIVERRSVSRWRFLIPADKKKNLSTFCVSDIQLECLRTKPNRPTMRPHTRNVMNVSQQVNEFRKSLGHDRMNHVKLIGYINHFRHLNSERLYQLHGLTERLSIEAKTRTCFQGRYQYQLQEIGVNQDPKQRRRIHSSLPRKCLSEPWIELDRLCHDHHCHHQ